MPPENLFIIIYAHPDVEEFVRRLENRTRAKFDRLNALLTQHGPALGMPFSRKVAPRLYELRVLGSPNTRFFYTFKGNVILFVHAITKKRDAIPSRDLLLARKRVALLR